MHNSQNPTTQPNTHRDVPTVLPVLGAFAGEADVGVVWKAPLEHGVVQPLQVLHRQQDLSDPLGGGGPGQGQCGRAVLQDTVVLTVKLTLTAHD